MRRVLAALTLALPLAVPAGLTAQPDFVTTRFELYLDALRKQAGIPGLSAAMVQDDRIAWEAGFGYQDLEAGIPVTPDTPFYVADLTSTLSATLVLQCIEEGSTRFDQSRHAASRESGCGGHGARPPEPLTCARCRVPLRAGTVCRAHARD